MNKEPTQPDPNQEKKSHDYPKDSTEVDLWDFDDDHSEFTTTNVPQEQSEGILSSHKSESKIQTERSIEITELAATLETATKTTEASGSEIIGRQKDDSEKQTRVAKPSLLSLTKTELIAISALFGVLILAATIAIIYFYTHVPTRALIAEKTSFPVIGKLVEIRSAATFWRKPITSGENPDTVRRGTELIPVIKLSLHSKDGAIRIFFRDEKGAVIGDAINRFVSGDQELVIPATAGFDDIGMHAAYRTGEQEPWTIQIYEGPSRSADSKDFRKVVETQISTDIH